MTCLYALLLLPPVQENAGWPTLAAVLERAGVPQPAGVAPSQRITSFAMLDDERWFAIGYYDLAPDTRLHALHVRAYDKQSGRWRSYEQSEPIGSIISVERNGRFFFVRGHSSPSAAPTLVLDAALSLRSTLNGWPKLMLEDGRVVFERDMVHFAPAHSGVLAIYDPRTNRDASFYSAGAGSDIGPEQVPGADEWIDRSIGDVRSGARRRLEFDVTIQRVRINQRSEERRVGKECRSRWWPY